MKTLDQATLQTNYGLLRISRKHELVLQQPGFGSHGPYVSDARLHRNIGILHIPDGYDARLCSGLHSCGKSSSALPPNSARCLHGNMLEIFHLCWLFDHYDPAPLFTFFCSEILVVALMMYFGPQPNNDVALFGMLATIHDLFSWAWRAPRMLI
jgi:hypothetical protein